MTPSSSSVVVERLGGFDGALTGHRVDDEERVFRFDGRADAADLVHQLGVDGEATGGVDDQHVAAEALRLGETGVGDRDRVGRLAEDGDADLAAEDAELLDRGGALKVGADEQRVAALAS